LCTIHCSCTFVAGARIAILCTLDYFVHVTLFTHALQSVITLMFYFFFFMFYDLLILFTCANIYIFLHECFWLTFYYVPLAHYPHNSHPDLGLDPSRVLVKFSRAYPWFSILIPFSFWGLKGPEGSKFSATVQNCQPVGLYYAVSVDLCTYCAKMKIHFTELKGIKWDCRPIHSYCQKKN